MENEQASIDVGPRQAVEVAVAQLRRAPVPRDEIPTLVMPTRSSRASMPLPAGDVDFALSSTRRSSSEPMALVDGAGRVTVATEEALRWLSAGDGSGIIARPLDELLTVVTSEVDRPMRIVDLLRVIGTNTSIRASVDRRNVGDTDNRADITIARTRSVIALESFVVTFAKAETAADIEGESWDLRTMRCLAEIGAAVVDEPVFDSFLRRCAMVMREEARVAGLRISTTASGGPETAGTASRHHIVVEYPESSPAALKAHTHSISLRFEPPLCSVEVLGPPPSERACLMLHRASRRLSTSISKRWAEDRLVELTSQFTLLDGVAEELASSLMTSSAMMQVVAEEIGRADGTLCVVELLKPNEDAYEHIVVSEHDRDLAERVRAVFDEAMTSSVPPSSQTPGDKVTWLRSAGVDVVSVRASAIRARGVTLGTFYVFHCRNARTHGSFDDVFLRAVGDRLGLAIHNARLFDANVDHMEKLEERVARRTEELEAALDGLRHAQTELVRSEKLSSLGALVAGVAHELNTPIGNAVLVATTLTGRLAEFRASIAGGAVRRSDFESFVGACDEATQLLTRCLSSARELLGSFKQVAADQTSELRRDFALDVTVSDVVETLRPRMRREGAHQIELGVQDSIAMNSFPGALGRVVTNLVLNAFIHGYEGAREGTVRVRVAAGQPGMAHIEVSDDGVGIPDDDLPRIFDPFFTTKLGTGGSGLGLNIVFNLVTNVLGGRIGVRTTVGRGTTFDIDIPCVAPNRSAQSGGNP